LGKTTGLREQLIAPPISEEGKSQWEEGGSCKSALVWRCSGTVTKRDKGGEKIQGRGQDRAEGWKSTVNSALVRKKDGDRRLLLRFRRGAPNARKSKLRT